MEQISKRFMNWASILQPDTRAQAERTSSMPFIHPHLALMPDAHLGKGATVGSVIPTGRDHAGRGGRRHRLRHDRGPHPVHPRPAAGGPASAAQAIEAAVPLSAGHYNADVGRGHTEELLADLERAASDADLTRRRTRQLAAAARHPGLGNHFIEVSLDEQDRVWLVLHSGSRGVGNKIATHHINVAQQECARWFIELADRDLAYLVEGTDEFAAYMRELLWAQGFALLNREEMMHRVVTCFEQWIGADVDREQEVNCHHNYTLQERHFGKDVWLTRKGAISAKVGEWGLIPGSMGTRSYVVTGKGNRLSLESAPHGAGREFSRTAARKAFTHDDLRGPWGTSSTATRTLRRRDPGRLQGHRRGHGGRRRPRARSSTRCARSST